MTKLFHRNFFPYTFTWSKDIIKKIELPIIMDKFDYARWGYFLNDKEKAWTKKGLDHFLSLYQVYFSLDGPTLLSQIPIPFNVGYVVNKEITNIHYEPYFLFRVCIDYKVPLTNETTIADLVRYVTYLKQPFPVVHRLAQVSLGKKDIGFLVSLIDLPNEEKSRDLSQLSKKERQQITPLNNEEAMILAAINYQCDLTQSNNALEDYFLLSSGLLNNRNHPLYFTDKLPKWVYSANQLKSMAINEGYTESEVNSHDNYQLMQMAMIEDNFYLITDFNRDKIINHETPFYREKIDDLSSVSLIGYGLYNKSYQVLTYKELSDYFQANLGYYNPFPSTSNEWKGKSLLSRRVVNKLKTFNNGELLNVIRKIEVYEKTSSSKIKELMSVPNPTKIIKTLKALLFAGFYMRGWNGPPQEYPIENTETKDQVMTMLRVTQALADYEELLAQTPIVNQLPLIHHNKGKYDHSNDVNKGLTIGERIEIIKTKDDNVNSCIRLSSNYIVASAYYYLTNLGVQVNMDINKLRNIA